MTAKQPTNAQIADVLDRIAELLEVQDANPFRVRAYREGGQYLRDLDQSVADLIRRDDTEKLIDLPHIGTGIAAVIGEYVSSGKSGLLDDLEAKVSPEIVIGKVPGIGPELAARIVDKLDIETLTELEEAAHDGRLATVEGFGVRRVEGVLTTLAGMLSTAAQSRQRSRAPEAKVSDAKSDDRPSVELLLKIDANYREQAKAGKLPKITPRRFNPEGDAWLPVMHTKREGWDFTALFSNTAKAHELEKTDDWVVIYYEKDGKERQNTVVTETQGALKDRRVVRGRDAESRAYYQVGTKK